MRGHLPPLPLPPHTCARRRSILEDPFIRNYVEDLLKKIRTQAGGRTWRTWAAGKGRCHWSWGQQEGAALREGPSAVPGPDLGGTTVSPWLDCY